MSLIRLHSIICHTYEIWWIVGSISTLMRNIVASLILHVCILFPNVLSVMRIVLRMLLTINQCNSIDVVILMIIIFVSSHNQFLFCSFYSNRSNRLGTITWGIYIGHILIRILYHSLSLILIHLRKHIASMNLRWVVHVHVPSLAISISFMNRWLSFHSSVMVWS